MKVPLTRSFGAKIFYLICFCLCFAITANSFQNGKTFYNYLNQNLESEVVQKAKSNAGEAKAVLNTWVSQIALAVHNTMGLSPSLYQQSVKNFLGSNNSFVAFDIFANTPSNPNQFRSEVFAFTDLENEKDFLDKNPDEVARSLSELNKNFIQKMKHTRSQDVIFKNLHPQLKLGMLNIAVPFMVKNSEKTVWAILTVWQNPLLEIFPTSKFSKINLLNKDLEPILNTSSANRIEKNSPLLKGIAQSDSQLNVYKWQSDSNKAMLSAFSKLQPFNLYVVVDNDTSQANLLIKSIVIKTALYSLLFLLFAVIITYFATSGIVHNLKEVANATARIASGDFRSKIFLKSRDEVGALGVAVNAMSDRILSLLDSKVEMARMEKELETAKLVQKSFFPNSSYQSGPLRIVAKNFAASECCGDWWGHFSTGDGKEFLFIADATGHGAPAALATAMIYSISTLLSQLLTKKLSTICTLPEIFNEFNQVLWTAGKGKSTMTLFGLCLDTNTGEMTLVNGGHNFPIFIPQSKTDSRFSGATAHKEFKMKTNTVNLTVRGNPLGVVPDENWKETKISLAPGDKIVLYTDGIIECVNMEGKEWGKRNLMKTVEEHANAEPELLKNVLFGKAFYHFGTKAIDDDMTVVVLEMDHKWRVAA